MFYQALSRPNAALQLRNHAVSRLIGCGHCYPVLKAGFPQCNRMLLLLLSLSVAIYTPHVVKSLSYILKPYPAMQLLY